MGSLRPSMRSKASGPLGTHVPNGHAMANGNPTLRDELSVFESESFNADSYVQAKCQSMNEKGIRKLCAELLELKKDSAEEMRKSVYANYSAFIRTSREISDLEGELVSMRNLLNTHTGIIHKLAEMRLPSMISENGSAAATYEHDYADNDEEDETFKLEREAESLPDLIDVYVTERKIDTALEALEKGDNLVSSLKLQGVSEDKLSVLRDAYTERKVRLAELLAEFSRQPSIKGPELRAVIAALDKLGDGPQAHTLLLSAHHEQLQHAIQGLRPNGTSLGGAYTAALSQLIFSHIARAARDSTKVFGYHTEYASELILWARNEVEKFAMLIKKYVLSASAASGGLRAAAECVQIALGHCELLESHGLALCPVLTKLVKPCVEQALDANLRRIEDSITVLAAADDWVPQPPPSRTGTRAGTAIVFPPHLKLSSSAYRFISMVQDFLDDVIPLSSMHLTSTTLDGVARLFESYVELLLRALPIDEEDEEITDNLNIKFAETDVEKLVLLGNAAALADELLPRAIAKFFPLAEDWNRRDKHAGGVRSEQRDFRRKTQRAVDRLRDKFCRKSALELTCREAELSATVYLSLDGEGGNPPPEDGMPSLFFQELFHKFNALASAGSEVCPGRERFLTLLLIKLVDYVLLLLSTDDYFWEELEEGVKLLGRNGLQQLVLDMHFCVQMAGQVNHSSLRHLNQLASSIISRGMEAFAICGMDPNSVLPDTNWFIATAQDAIDKLSSEWTKEPVSPTASISNQSVSSSIRSHGSP